MPKGQNIHGVDVVRFTADFSTIDLFNWCIAKGETSSNVKPGRSDRDVNTPSDSKSEDRIKCATSDLPSGGCMRVPVDDVGTYRCPIDLRKATDALPCARWVVDPSDDDWTGVD